LPRSAASLLQRLCERAYDPARPLRDLLNTSPQPPLAVLLDVGDTILTQHWFDLSLGIDAVVHDRERSEELAADFRSYELPAYARGDECLLAEWLRAQVPALDSLTREVIEDRIWTAVVRMEPQPDVGEVLDRLTHDLVPLGAVSNAAFSGRRIREELDRHGLGAAFQFVLSSADLRVRKPARGIFQAAVDRIKQPASRTWFVGDTFDEDIVGGNAAGLQPIWLSNGRAAQHSALEVPVVRNWAEFLTFYSTQTGESK